MTIETAIEADTNPFNGGYNVPPLSGSTTGSFVSMYNSPSSAMAPVADSFPIKVDISFPYSHRFLVSGNRPKDNPMTTSRIQDGNCCSSLAFLGGGDDVLLQIRQQQLEMERFITHHNNEVRIAIKERRKRDWRSLITVVEERVMKRLKAKDDEIEKITKLNWALQEKVQSLSVEGQIWQDAANTNEAAAHALRTSLERVLTAQFNNNEQANAATLADDEQSCCGSNYQEEGERCRIGRGESKCGHCGEAESSVLLLPCRHLCLCTVCGSSVHTCPVCKTPKNARVNVIMSS